MDILVWIAILSFALERSYALNSTLLMDPTTQLISFFVLILLSGFFSASETALVSLSSASVRSMVDRKVIGAKLVHFLKERPQKMLITILIGNNVVNIAASVMATRVAEDVFKSDSIALIVGTMTLIILIFGEVVPKSLAQRFRRQISVIFGSVLYILYFLLYPFTYLFDQITNVFFYITGQKKHKSITEDELRAMIEIGHEEGEVEKQEREFLQNIFEFTDTTAEEILTPASQIQSLNADMTIDKALADVVKGSHSRFPVFLKNINHVIGYVTVRNLLHDVRSKNHDPNKKVGDIKLHQVLHFPVTRPIAKIFQAFQKKHTHMAIIVDEFGHTSGLITMENILEEIVGDIIDETDIEEDNIIKVGKNSYLLKGSCSMDQVFEEYSFDIPVDSHKSVAFLILKKLGAFPREGEKVEFSDGSVEMVVENMKDNRVETVRMTVRTAS